MVKILNTITPTFLDYPDNESIALCVCFMGCEHHCLNCHNPLFQNPDHNEGTMSITVDELFIKLQELAKRNRTNKIVLSGGDPLAPYNIKYTKELLKLSANIFDICIYTGYNIQYIIDNDINGFKFVKCGRYCEDLKQTSQKDDDKMVFASTNQAIYGSNCKLLSENGIYRF